MFWRNKLQDRGIFIESERWMKLPSETGWKQMPIINSQASLPSASYPAGNLELARVANLNREIFTSRTRATRYEHTCSWIMSVGAFCREGEVSLSRRKSFWPQVGSRWGRWVTQVIYLIHRPLCDVTLRGTCTGQIPWDTPSAHEAKGVPPCGMMWWGGLWSSTAPSRVSAKEGSSGPRASRRGMRGFNHSCFPIKRFLHSNK